MRDNFMQALIEEARKDPNVVLMTGDLGFGVFEGFAEEFPQQFFNIGVAEQNMLGVATGMAMEGRKVVAYSIGNFPTIRCLEQIRNDACYHDANVTVVASGGGFSYGALGMSHHATEDLALLRALPGTTVISPCSEQEAGDATHFLINSPGVGYLRLDKSAVAGEFDQMPFEAGKAKLYRQGGDITLIATGGIMEEAMEAADRLSEQGIEARVLGIHTVKPIDEDAIVAAARETGGIVTIEEHNVAGGLGGSVAEVCMDHGAAPKCFHRIGLKDTYSSVVGGQRFLRNYYGMDAEAIVSKVVSMMDQAAA